MKKIKKMIYLTEEQEKILKKNKEETGVSEAFQIRRALNEYFKIENNKK